MYTTKNLFDLDHTIAKEYLEKYEYPWEALPEIKNFIKELIEKLDKNEYKEVAENVWAHKSVSIAPSASLTGPAIIGKDSEIRPSAYIRGNAIIGEGCVIGNSCEIKNAIIFDKSQVPHFNYVGDAILGFHAHMGAGSIVSNLKADGRDVVIRDGEEVVETHLRKFGAMIGDNAEIGCNSVMNPGTVIGRNSNVYPLARVRGLVPANSIYKDEDNIVEKRQ
ncbi:MAG: UDP-N-acetylglucosamine pyrophosphorylase [Erysipelotrichaceae bacterium]|nr:UDP-N-acetylglucosamine pyrophosphorylase [Erysipelotrichaceae bacterium]MBQ6492385.1 UDP-N-acetylglucosamine pyrophosphorylase [Erysipelotrichaceae bacterium]